MTVEYESGQGGQGMDGAGRATTSKRKGWIFGQLLVSGVMYIAFVSSTLRPDITILVDWA